jgi:DNA-binding transcriptional ArsR family regulator
VRAFPHEETRMTVSHPLSADLVELIADRFGALSDPVRIRLLDRLREGEASVLSLTAAIGTTPQNVSKHLAVLRRAGIVARRKQGNFAYYSIVDQRVFELCETVCGSLERQLESLGQVVAGARSH